MTSRTLNSTAPSANGWLLFTFVLSTALVVFMVSTVRGQPHRDVAMQPGVSHSEELVDDARPRVTYGGRIYLSFPHYDVVLSGGPRSINELGRTAGNSDARVIYKDRRQMRWDGRGFFLHPAYPYELVSRYRYANRIVGRPGEQWPPVEPRDDLVRIPRPRAATKVAYHPESVIPPGALAVPRADAIAYFVERPWVVKEPATLPPPAMIPSPRLPSSRMLPPPSYDPGSLSYSGYLSFDVAPDTSPTTQITAHRSRRDPVVRSLAPVSVTQQSSHFDCRYATWYPGGSVDCQAVWSGTR